MKSFIAEICKSSLLTTPAVGLSELVQQYDPVLSSVLDSYAPSIEQVVTKRPLALWYTPEIKAKNTKRRKLERKWRRSRLTIDRELYVRQCEVVKELIESAKHSYYTKIIDQHQSDHKVLFSTFARVLLVNSEKHHPESSSSNQLANSFADYFEDKILSIRRDLLDLESSCDCIIKLFIFR